jgi:peptide/nickel transport system substrate-binding protein
MRQDRAEDQPMNIRRRFLLTFLAMTLLASPAMAEELRLGARSEFVIDPHFLFVGPNMAAARHLYDSFVARDAESRWQPGLAESWRLVDDTTWEFKLRRGVTFHDGSPFTAADVVFSLERIPAIPNNPGPYTTNLRSIEATEVVDPYTIRFRTAWPNPVLPGQFTNVFILSARAAAGATPADFTSGKAAVGTGPFRLVAFSRGEKMVLERNATYWGDRPAWDRVEIRVMANDTARIAALLAGDVDLIEEVPPSEVSQLERSGKAAVFRRIGDRVMYLLPNVGAERLVQLVDADGAPLAGNPLRDRRVRQAISKAIQREALVDRALDGQGVAAAQIVPEGFGGYDPVVKREPYDPEGARRLLAEAGYSRGFGLTLACTNDRYVNDARICQALGQMLTRVGIKTRVETYPGSIFFGKVRATKSEVPLILYGSSNSSTRDATHLLSLVVHGHDELRGFGQSNRGDYRNPTLDALIERAIVATAPDRHELLLREAIRAATDDLGQIPLYNQMVIVAARKGIAYTPRMDEQFVATEARPAQ